MYVLLYSWNFLLFTKAIEGFSLWQGYASTEGSLGNSVLLISDMSDVARDASFPAEVKLRAALRLLFTKQPT